MEAAAKEVGRARPAAQECLGTISPRLDRSMGQAAKPAMMEGEDVFLYQMLRTEARRMAAVIRQVEVVSPSCFGEAAAGFRQLAAGDEVAI